MEGLKEFQSEAVDFAFKVKTMALIGEQGTGKTWITTGIIHRLISEQASSSCLLIVPLANLETTWNKLLTQKLTRANITQDFKNFKKLKGHRILLVHYEAVNKLIKKLVRVSWDLIVYDESQRLKDRGSLQSRNARKLRNSSSLKIILTGTPIEKTPIDLWAQFRFLNPDVFGDKWSRFDEDYLVPTGFMGYQRKLRKNRVAKFSALMEPFIFRVQKDEVLSLPKLTIHKVPVVLRGDHKRIYDQLDRDTFIDSKTLKIMTRLRITQIVKLHQISGGYVVDDDGEVQEVGYTKLRKTSYLVSTLEKPIVIFCRYVAEIFGIYDRLKDTAGRVEMFYGKVKKKRRVELLKEFQEGKIDVLIIQVRTGSVGIDLYRSFNGIVYSTTFSYIDFDQLVARFHRYGQEHPVSIFLLIAQKTIDEGIVSAVMSKQRLTKTFLKRFRRQLLCQKKQTKPKERPLRKLPTKPKEKPQKRPQTKTKPKERPPRSQKVPRKVLRRPVKNSNTR